MTHSPIQFPYVQRDPLARATGLAPMLPITLQGNGSVDVQGLLDTGASVNVLPHQIGLDLGAVWDQQTHLIPLTGNLSQYEARVLFLTGIVWTFPPVKLAFAWTKADHVPLLLGQVNFFMEFNVCFFRSQGHFEIQPK